MKKGLFLILGLVSVLAIVTLGGCAGTASPDVTGFFNTQQEGVWVSGTGKVTVAPDIATLRLGIEAQQATVAEAQSAATGAMNQVMDALKDNGVADKDIQTQYFRIQKVTRWDDEKRQEIVIGYRVTNMVTAKIRDIAEAGTVIDAVALAGGDLTRIDSISFSVDDPSAYHEEAREKAMADAKAKAEQLAELGGITLGKPTYISESVVTPSPIYPVRAEAAAPVMAETPISAGETDISLTVQVVYAIK
jgi:uncharacterized protein YggE